MFILIYLVITFQVTNENRKRNMPSSLEENYSQLKAMSLAMNPDMEKVFTKHIKTAGDRVKSSLLDMKKLCDTMRKQLSEEFPAKSRKTKTSDSEGETKDDEDMDISEVEPLILKSEDTVTEKKKRARKANIKKPKEETQETED